MMTETLERNLAALALRNPGLAGLIRASRARADVTFCPTDDGVASGMFGDGRALASRRRPLQEGRRWAEPVDLLGAGVFVVQGFGLGHHVRALAERVGRHGLIVVLEPDVGLLRAVFERIECPFLATSAVLVVHDPEDITALNRGIVGLEAFVALGVALLDHPPSVPRLGDAPVRFSQTVARLVRATRTQLATTLVQCEVTLRNELMNADRYVTSEGIAGLAGKGGGRPAIVVSAGPSLGRNLHLLAQPGVRERFVIIAVQTVLKTLLERGIRPHYVTALDYHEISRRFYEGLTARDVEGIELVVEPKANAAILEAFPGVIRCAADERLDRVLGEQLAEAKGAIEPGATVAHLAYAFARHLKCDPVILIGQDLGFTDGQYYAAGAAIHHIWGAELNPFRTLEMFEWERIARGRHLLSRVEDQRGGTMYTDEQMGSYLVQFERMFAADAERGLTTIDATEGGTKKRWTQVLPLAEALERFGRATSTTHGATVASAGDELDLPQSMPLSPAEERRRLRVLEERLRLVRKQAGRIGAICRETRAALEATAREEDDAAARGSLVRIDALRREVESLEPGYGLVQFISQTAALHRLRADRALALAQTMDEAERRRRRIERDTTNVTWLGEAAERVSSLLEAAIKSLSGGPKLTRDPAESQETAVRVRARPRVWAVVPFDPSADDPAFGVLVAGRSALRLTLDRLARCTQIVGTVVLTRDPERVRAALPGRESQRLQIVQNDAAMHADRAAAVRAARAFAGDCWRGGLGGLTVYDEIFHAGELAPVMSDLGMDAALLVGAAWCLVDPALLDEIVCRYASDPEHHPLVFTQAAPGLGGALVSSALVDDLARQQQQAGPLATIGGMLGYFPSLARPDPITKSGCVMVSPSMRDLQARCIADNRASRKAFAEVLGAPGFDAGNADSLACAQAIAERLHALAAPSSVTIELCTGRRTSGQRAHWLYGHGEAPERAPMSRVMAERVFAELAEWAPGAAISFGGAGDPLHHAEWAHLVGLARSCGLGPVHVRTDLVGEADDVAALLETGVEIISIDLLAHSRAVYARVAGLDLFGRARENTEQLVQGARRRWSAAGGFGIPWVVPRLTRCEAVAEEIEPFYDYWLGMCGAAVIDALPRAVRGERFAPLPLPAAAQRRLHGRALLVRCDGSIVVGERVAGHVDRGGLADAMKRVRRSVPGISEAA
ncbi:MAG: DUF115 domain-containing protein [Phycisphaeraceae bacterium]|nr:DUF115 domain-containing protein [Phycisphaeraceae bacterium]